MAQPKRQTRDTLRSPHSSWNATRNSPSSPASSGRTGRDQTYRSATTSKPQPQGLRVSTFGDPDETFSNVLEKEREYYNDAFRPLNRELIDDVDSTELVDTAKEDATEAYESGRAQGERQRLRYGVSNTPLDRSRNEVDASYSKGLNYDQTVNSARLKQYDRNVGLRNQLVNVSRNIATSATDDLGTAAAMKTKRDNMNANMDAQNDAARTRMIGSAAGMALMAAIMM